MVQLFDRPDKDYPTSVAAQAAGRDRGARSKRVSGRIARRATIVRDHRPCCPRRSSALMFPLSENLVYLRSPSAPARKRGRSRASQKRSYPSINLAEQVDRSKYRSAPSRKRFFKLIVNFFRTSRSFDNDQKNAYPLRFYSGQPINDF
jgi:hypothetical protein